MQRQITHRPLRYAPDRSLSERAHKWVLRHPRLSSAGSVSLVAAGLLLCLLTAFFVRQSYVRKLENQQRIAQVQHKLVAARGLLSGRDESPAEIDAGLQQCDDALKLLKLSSDDSEEVRQIQAELLLQKSRGLFSAAMRQTSLAKKSEFLTAARKTNDQTVSFAQEGSLHLRWLAQRVEILARSEKPYESELAQLKSLSGAKADSAGTAYAQAALDSLRGEVDVKAADADYWLARGKLEALLNRLPEAQSSLRLAMELAPNSPWPVYHAALLNLENANYSKAKSLLDRAIELAPQNTDAYFNRALVRLKTGDAANAIADLDKVGPTLEEFPRAYFVRELAKRGLGDGASAAADLQKGLSLTPTDALSWNARGEARLRATVSDPKGALSDFSQAIALDPYLREAYENKAHVLSEVEGKIDLAIDTLTEAVQKFPDYTLARSSLAVLLARAGKREEARTEAELALTKDRSAIICYQVACVYLLTYQNETDEARAISLLKETVRKEPQLADLMPTDQDLLRVRNGTDLRALLEAINRLR